MRATMRRPSPRRRWPRRSACSASRRSPARTAGRRRRRPARRRPRRRCSARRQARRDGLLVGGSVVLAADQVDDRGRRPPGGRDGCVEGVRAARGCGGPAVSIMGRASRTARRGRRWSGARARCGKPRSARDRAPGYRGPGAPRSVRRSASSTPASAASRSWTSASPRCPPRTSSTSATPPSSRTATATPTPCAPGARDRPLARRAGREADRRRLQHGHARSRLADLQRGLDVPVIGVIEPEVRAAAVRATRNRHVGLMATEATVRSGSYPRMVRAHDAGRPGHERRLPRPRPGHPGRRRGRRRRSLAMVRRYTASAHRGRRGHRDPRLHPLPDDRAPPAPRAAGRDAHRRPLRDRPRGGGRRWRARASAPARPRGRPPLRLQRRPRGLPPPRAAASCRCLSARSRSSTPSRRRRRPSWRLRWPPRRRPTTTTRQPGGRAPSSPRRRTGRPR